ncbi:hypothetical protein JCM11251_007130 [Rhodosporidiobolus azoricus]
MLQSGGQNGAKAVPTHAVRSLLLIDGNEVFPAIQRLGHGSEGGCTAALQLHEQMRRWVSSNLGEETSGSVQLFGDLIELSRALHIPLDKLHDFARNFSSAPRPSACIDCPKSKTHAVLRGHLAYDMTQVEVVFLAGFTSDLHFHWLQRVIPLHSSLQVVLVRTNRPSSPAMMKLAPKWTSFLGLMNVGTSPATRDITSSSGGSEGEEEDGQEELVMRHMETPSPAQAGRGWAEESRKLIARPLRPIESFGTPSSWAAMSGAPSPSASPARPSPAKQRATGQLTGGWAQAGQGGSTSAAAAYSCRSDSNAGTGSDVLTVASTASLEQQADLLKPAFADTADAPSASVASPWSETRSSSPSASPSTFPAIATISATQPPPSATFLLSPSPAPAVPQPRAPPVPPQYLPLLRIVLSLEKTLCASTTTSPTSPSSPLWSAVGTALAQSDHAGKYGKLQTYLLQAQREGWVTTGKGEGEGSEWIRVSQRGVRAMKKVK